MRTRVIAVIVTLFFLQACDAPSGGGNLGEGGNRPPKPVTTESESLPTVVPVQVAGLKAVFISPKVKLTWDRVDGAFGYEIYRDSDNLPSASPSELRLAVPGSRLKLVAETDFNDFDLDLGYKYTYRVVAVNRVGKGPASKPAAVNAVLFPGWLKAPVAGPTEVVITPGFSWDDAIGAVGGDQGAPSTTVYPVPATKFTSCTGYGAALGAQRPATNTLLPAAPQTFMFDVNYNLTGGVHTYEFSATAISIGTGAQIPVFHETGTLSGCGTKQIIYTADFSGLELQSLTEYLTIYDSSGWNEVFWRGEGYDFESGVWMRIEETVPAAGATLTGGALSARIRYNKLPPMNAVLQIDTGTYGPVFATVVTAISGSGDFTLGIPYQTECGYPTGRLRLFEDHDEIYISKSLSFLMSSTTTPRMHVSNSDVWLSPYSGSYSISADLNVASCVAMAVPVTITASPGWQISRYEGVGGTQQSSSVVTGMTNDYYRLRLPDSSTVSFGTITGVATAYFPSSTTRSAVFRAHVFDYFWKKTPPAASIAGVSYPIEVTVAGPRPLSNIYLDSYYGMYDRLQWSEAANAYAGAISFPTCGNFGLYAGSYSPFGNTTPYAYSLATGSVSIESYNYYFYFNKADPGPKQYYLEDACGQTFTWSIVYAPAWLRFQSLTGSSTDPLEVGMMAAEAFPNNTGYSVEGMIGVQANGAGRVFEIEVVAYR